MSNTVIPAEVRLAAKRGFVRTTFQAYAATLTAGGISAATILAVVQDPSAWLLAGINLGLALVAPPVAGLASYLNIVANGVPREYTEAAEIQ